MDAIWFYEQFVGTYLFVTVPKIGGEPIGYFNWDMMFQAVSQGIESAALFGGAYLALEYAFSKGWISKFDS
jgi:hypothetical protein